MANCCKKVDLSIFASALSKSVLLYCSHSGIHTLNSVANVHKFITMAKRFEPKTTAYNQPKTNAADETLVDLGEVKDKFQHFTDQYSKWIYGGVIGLFVLVGGYFAYHNFITLPRERAASEKISGIQKQFAMDSFNNVLQGAQGSYMGALSIISQYGGTKAGNLARYYAGVAYLQNGEFDNAIKTLGEFSTGSDMVQAMAYGLLGDAWSEKQDFAQALDYYKKAADNCNNTITTPYFLWKAGVLLEQQGKPAEAKALYERVKKEYPRSAQGEEIDIYLARVGE